MTAPRYMIGASVQDWYQMGLEARTSALDAHDGELPPAAIAWAFVLDNPEMFGDCEVWPKDFPCTMPRDFRAAYNSGRWQMRNWTVSDIYRIPVDADGYRTLPNGKRVRVGDEICIADFQLTRDGVREVPHA